jgi:3-phenylpropionate/cinnamic acid dioxygenase small subunit
METKTGVKPAGGTAGDAAAKVSLTAARDFVDTFVSTLDRAEFDQWLELFAADGYYAVLRQLELVQDNNVVLIGEDMKRLRARIASGRDRDKRRTVHSVSGVRVAAAGDEISAAFTLWYDGIPTYAGRYLFAVTGTGDAVRIRKCTVVLDNDIIRAPIYMPI